MSKTGVAAEKAGSVAPVISWKSPMAISVAYQLLLVAVIIGGALHQAGRADAWAYLTAMLQRWDAEHYLRIAAEGYSRDPALQPFIVFFPFYPLLIAALAPALGHLRAAFTVTTIASIAGHALLFYYLRLIGYDARRAYRVAALVFVSPISIYFTSLYSEATYLLVTVLFLILLRREHYFMAAACGFFAALTRNMGLLFAIPYLCACWRSGPPKTVIRRAAYSALIGGGTAVYLGINAWVLGDPLAFTAHLSSDWYKESVNPIAKYWQSLLEFRAETWQLGPGYELIYVDRAATLLFPLLFATYLFLLRGQGRSGAGADARVMPAGFFLWALAQYLVICSQSFWVSNLRYLSLVLPGYLMLERVLQRRWTYATYLSLSAMLAVWAGYQYVRQSWVF